MFSYNNHNRVTMFASSCAAVLGLLALLFLVSVSSVAAQTPTPSLSTLYVDIGESYEKAGQSAKAAEFYIKALEADLTNTAAQDALRSVVDSSDNLTTKVIEQQNDLIKVIAAGLALVILLLLLLLTAKLVKLIRQRLIRRSVEYNILPFDNATGTRNLDGVEEGARAAIVEWLHHNHEVVKDDKPESPVPNTLPDVGQAASVFNWLVTQATPTPNSKFVNGTLQAPRQTKEGRTEWGLSVRVSNKTSGQIELARTFRAEWTKPDDPHVYVELACAAASWLCEPTQALKPAAAYKLGEANAMKVRSNLEPNEEKKTALAHKALKLAKEADNSEKELPQAAVAQTESATEEAETSLASTMAEERVAKFQRHLESLPEPRK